MKPRSLTVWVSAFILLAMVVTACGTPGLPVTPQPGGDAAAQPQPAADQGNAPAAAPNAANPRLKGKADAPVRIVEFSDFQCPFCSRWVEQTYPVLLKEYIDTGKVSLEFRDFPLASIHPNATISAVASRCAGEQGAYWEMHDKLFASQEEWSQLADAKPTFKGYAEALGLDGAAFEQCLASGKFDQDIQADLQAGQAAGVSGTPSFLINDELVVGALPAETFRQYIETVLAGGKINNEPPQAAQPQEPPQPVDIPIEGAPVKGNPDAPMTIVEYSDYQCPFCARFVDETMGALVQEYVDSGKAKLVFKDFPLEQIHPNAAKAAEAARCARELGGDDEAYWAMHDALFAAQEEWGQSASPVDLFVGYAEKNGLTGADFKACLESGKHAAAVQADLQEGLQFGVQGTPTFFINGQAFVGAQPLANFRQAIAMVEEGKSIAPPPQPTPAPPPTPAPLTQDVPLDTAAGIKGNADAPITIVEYSDYQCPFCQRHFQQVWPALQKYIDDGTVKYVFKDFPLNQIHPQAAKAAEAARCAGEQDAYWEMHDKLFASQQEWSGQATAVDIFKGYAGQLELDQAAFDQCLDSGKHAAVVQDNLEEGAGFGVRGTPGFYVNKQPLPGAYPIEAFEQLIQAELAQQ